MSATTTAAGPMKTAGPRRRRFVFRPFYLLILAWVIGVLGPYLWMVITSVTPSSEIVTSGKNVLPSQVSFEGYARLLAGGDFFRYMINSATVAIGTVILTTMIALLAGTALSRFRFKGRSAIMYSILLVQLLAPILLIVPLYIELKALGLLNSKIGLILVYTAFSLPFSTWLMKGFVDQIPTEVEEASFIDGCSRFQSFFAVILPLTRPGIAAAGTYSFIYAWNEFLFALTFTQDASTRTIPVGLRLYIGENTVHWDTITAGGVIAAMPILIAFLFAQKTLVSGLTSGAVKG